MDKLSGTALVTGAGVRLGRAIAIQLAELGYDIAIHYNRSQEPAEQTLKAVESMGGSGFLVAADFSDQEQVERLVEKVVSQADRLEVLVNSASIFEAGGFLEEKPGQLDRHFKINFQTPYILSREFVRQCDSGQIINIVDTRIQGNNPSHFSYSLSKKTLADFTLMAAKTLGPKFRVNAIGPGLVLPPSGADEKYLDQRAESIPLQQKGEIANIQQAVKYLIKNPFVTGQILFVDGGEGL